MRYDHFSMLPELAFQPRNGRYGMTLEGGKGGGSAPAPDPNIGKAQLELAALSREYLNEWKTEVWPTLKAQSEKQLARADEQFALDRDIQLRQREIADIEYARRQELFFPIEERQISEAMGAGGAADQERQAALALGDVRAATARQQRDIALQQQSFGIDPNSGRYQGMQRAAGVDTAAVEAAAANRARQAAEQLGWAKRMDALALGAGQFGNQATATGLSLSAGQQALNAGQVPMQNAALMTSTMGNAYGTSMGGWGQVGNLGVQKYNADVNAYAAREKASAERAGAFGETLGSLAGTGAALYMASDRRLKTNIERIGTLEKLGIGVYSFKYIDELKDQYGTSTYIGVMADEVEQVIPEAVITMNNGFKAVNYSMVI